MMLTLYEKRTFSQISSVLIILQLKQISDIEGNEKQPYYICCLSFSIYNVRRHEILPIPQMMPIQSKVCFEHPEAMQQWMPYKTQPLMHIIGFWSNVHNTYMTNSFWKCMLLQWNFYTSFWMLKLLSAPSHSFNSTINTKYKYKYQINSTTNC